MSRYSRTYVFASSAVRSGHARRRMAASGRPVIVPTRSKSRAVPPCASITRFAVSTTKRTLSVSVPSRSHSTARTRGAVLATAAARGGGHGRLDREDGLLRDPAIAGVLTQADQTLELVVQGVRVLQA